jgi:hypothetical protein
MSGWETKARYIADQLRGIPGVVAAVAVNTAGFADVDLSWDQSVIPLTPQELKDRLKQGEPPLVYDGTTVRTRCLDDGEERLVAERLRRFFTSEAPRKRSQPTPSAHRSPRLRQRRGARAGFIVASTSSSRRARDDRSSPQPQGTLTWITSDGRLSPTAFTARTRT